MRSKNPNVSSQMTSFLQSLPEEQQEVQHSALPSTEMAKTGSPTLLAPSDLASSIGLGAVELVPARPKKKNEESIHKF